MSTHVGLSPDTRDKSYILRNAAAQLYSSLYGRLTPTCVPQGLGIVIDLKEKVARTSMASPVVTTLVAPAEDTKLLHSSQVGVHLCGLTLPPNHFPPVGGGTSLVGQTSSATLKIQLPGMSLVDSPQVVPPTPPIKPLPLSLKLAFPSPLTPAKLSSPSLTILEGHTPDEGMMMEEGVVSPSHQLKKHKSEHKHKKKHKHKEDRHGDQKGEGNKEEHRRKHKHRHSKDTSSQGEL
eukprot:Em0011g717a